MRLDKALYHRWAGKDIKRKRWGKCQAIGAKHTIGIITPEDLDAEDWEVVPEYVGWDEAWKALVDGKRITVAGGGPFIMIGDSNIRSQSSGSEMNSVPLWWMNYKQFEILED